MFTYINDETEIINVALKCDIRTDKHFKSLPKNKYFDLISPYGYGGTLIQTTNEADIAAYFKALQNYCIKKNIVCEFVRFHPLINNYKLLQDEFEIIQLGETVALDLADEETIWSNLQPRMKSKIRTTMKSGVEIYFSNDSALKEEFINLYTKTMKKNDASDYYFFKDEFYDSLFVDLKYNVMFCYAKYEGKIISIAAILLGREILHYHLSGTDQKYHKLAPNNAILLNTALWGARNRYKYLHLGGGVGSQADDLLKYKKKFNQNSSLRFSIGKKIYNQEKYDELVKLRGKEVAGSSFFPQYRA
ncbi:peptidoglycan bridge formation glycyltransferase FemA/FemB family protein [Macrococcoides goetzii]|uniref:Lipid II:glycine glycyltransferase n=1 Tax=Macrococcoides goetzii TaxID=1891097 RepID=A0A395G7H6_9STAP|nr:GNAT family N-acetyltransferase [Macrococcus goetzii]RAI79920.1 peptidoglycan bridge formation glycyltransferase FemA/FemB family protein [Macrococcus goetzii]